MGWLRFYTVDSKGHIDLGPFRAACYAAGIEVNASDADLEWAIGFIEGDGSLTTHGPTRAYLLVVQKDIVVLQLLQSIFGFGSVAAHGEGYWHWTVSSKEHLLLMIELLNGNLHTPHRVEQMAVWCSIYGVEYISTSPAPSLLTSWLAGFTDAEGCFSATNVGAVGVKFRFILDQKAAQDLLVLIAALFGAPSSSVVTRFNTGNQFRMTVGATYMLEVVAYYAKHPLRSSKAGALERWQALRARSLAGTLTTAERDAATAAINGKTRRESK